MPVGMTYNLKTSKNGGGSMFDRMYFLRIFIDHTYFISDFRSWFYFDGLLA